MREARLPRFQDSWQLSKNTPLTLDALFTQTMGCNSEERGAHRAPFRTDGPVAVHGNRTVRRYEIRKVVREGGLEPPRPRASDPKSDVSAVPPLSRVCTGGVFAPSPHRPSGRTSYPIVRQKGDIVHCAALSASRPRTIRHARLQCRCLATYTILWRDLRSPPHTT